MSEYILELKDISKHIWNARPDETPLFGALGANKSLEELYFRS